MKLEFTNKEKFRVFALTIASKADMQIKSLEILYQNNTTFNAKYLEDEINKHVENINKNYLGKVSEDDLQIMLSNLSSYYGISVNETKLVLSNYMIVGTYSFFEKSLKSILKLTDDFSDNELRSMFRIAQVKTLINRKYSIDYETLDEYSKIEELRCLNNCIKHNGIVSQELVDANNKWILESSIENTIEDFIRLKDAPLTFLTKLIELITQQISD